MIRIRRALISVSDTTGLEQFARALHSLGIELVASAWAAWAVLVKASAVAKGICF